MFFSYLGPLEGSLVARCEDHPRGRHQGGGLEVLGVFPAILYSSLLQRSSWNTWTTRKLSWSSSTTPRTTASSPSYLLYKAGKALLIID